MVRDKFIIYAEKNDEDTVLSNDLLTDSVILVGGGDKFVKQYINNGLIVNKTNNELEVLPIPTSANNILCTIDDLIGWRAIR